MQDERMKMSQDLRDTIGWIVLQALPADMPVVAARSVIEAVVKQVEGQPGGVQDDEREPRTFTGRLTAESFGHEQPPPPPTEADPVEAEQWPTVRILRRTLQAVADKVDLDEAMAVLVGQALRASDWVEQYGGSDDERGDVRRAASRGPLPDLSTPEHLSPR